jgi:hypothetical protein
MVTAGGLVFIGATRDKRFRAFDSRTVAVTAATQGQGNTESLHVFALP